RIARLRPVVLPGRSLEEFLKTVGVAVLQQVTGLLPAEDVIGRHTPGSAAVMALAHQKFKEQSGLVEPPGPLAVGKNGAKQLAGAGAAKEMPLVRGLLVGVARGKHHAFYPELHHVVKESAYAFGIGAVK